MNATKHLLCSLLTVLLMTACKSESQPAAGFIQVQPQAETQPVPDREDAADDPVIWIHPQDPLKSLIIGTDKQFGLLIYNLQGEQVQAVERGRLNNVDLRQGIKLADELVTLAIQMVLPLLMEDPYGVCMHLDSMGHAHAFVNSTDGEYQHWLLNPQDELRPQLLNTFKLASQPEGCAVDDVTQMLYLGEENRGIWMLPLAQVGLAPGSMRLLDSLESSYLAADIEGMDVYRRNDEAWLVVSSQGNNSYAFYDLKRSGAYSGSVRITANEQLQIDGTEDTDGLAVTPVSLGMAYPEGLLVVQDGKNSMPDANQNFKLLSWHVVMQALKADMPEL